MLILLRFDEIGIGDYSGMSNAELIDSAVNFIMNNFFPEWDELDIFPHVKTAIVQPKMETIALAINPVWLRDIPH